MSSCLPAPCDCTTHAPTTTAPLEATKHFEPERYERILSSDGSASSRSSIGASAGETSWIRSDMLMDCLTFEPLDGRVSAGHDANPSVEIVVPTERQSATQSTSAPTTTGMADAQEEQPSHTSGAPMPPPGQILPIRTSIQAIYRMGVPHSGQALRVRRRPGMETKGSVRRCMTSSGPMRPFA